MRGASIKRWILLSAVLMIAGALLIWSQSSRTQELKLSPANVHWGYYDAAVKPVLRVASGDTIRVETMVARGLQRLRAVGVPEQEIPNSLKAVESAVTERGPVLVTEKGMKRDAAMGGISSTLCPTVSGAKMISNFDRRGTDYSPTCNVPRPLGTF